MQKRYAQGGSVKGAHGIDKVPAKLTDGEYVLPTKTVQAVGAPALDDLVQQTNGQAPGGKPAIDADQSPRQGILTKARGTMAYAAGGLVIPDNLQPKNLNTDPVTGAQLLARNGTPGFESAPGSSLPPAAGVRVGINQPQIAAAAPPVNNSTPNPTPPAANLAPPKAIIAAPAGSNTVPPQDGSVQKVVNGQAVFSSQTPASAGASGSGGGPAPAGQTPQPALGINPGGVAKPADAINVGIGQQSAYAAQERAAILKAANAAAADGNPGNATARYNAALHALTALSGSNNFGAIQEQGATAEAANQTNAVSAKARAEFEAASAREANLKGTEEQKQLDLQTKIENPNLTEAERGRALQAYYRRTGKGPFQFGVNPMTQEPYAGNSLTGEIKTMNPSGATSAQSAPVEGATATSNGHPMVFRNGQWQPEAAAR